MRSRYVAVGVVAVASLALLALGVAWLLLKGMLNFGMPEPGSDHPPAVVKQPTLGERLIGRWVDPSEPDAFMEYFPDGAFTGGRPQMPARGRWRVDAVDLVTIVMNSSRRESDMVLEGVRIQDEQMTFSWNGKRVTLKREK
jgi:hypothetical protein